MINTHVRFSDQCSPSLWPLAVYRFPSITGVLLQNWILLFVKMNPRIVEYPYINGSSTIFTSLAVQLCLDYSFVPRQSCTIGWLLRLMCHQCHEIPWTSLRFHFSHYRFPHVHATRATCTGGTSPAKWFWPIDIFIQSSNLSVYEITPFHMVLIFVNINLSVYEVTPFMS